MTFDKFATTFDDMLSNAAAIKGEAYVKLVLHAVNQQAIIKLVDAVATESASSGQHALRRDESPYVDMLSIIIKQNITMAADILKISDELLEEALQFANTLTAKGESICKDGIDEENE